MSIDQDLGNKDQNLISISIEEEMKRSYMDYAMSVIVSRAIPDLRDGLKPVHRRILYSMHEGGYNFNKPYRKSARIVGDVIGKYHPHGDVAIYDSLVRMAQSFALQVPLVDGQGNFGSIDGDKAAAMRYTESRLAKISHSMLEDIEKDTVKFSPNYDNSEQEPDVLPSSFPNLLINGSSGIAVGMATNIPPHNMGEIIDACCAYIDDDSISIEELLTFVKGPDFPTGGVILGTSGIKSAYLTGRGSIISRGRHVVEEVEEKKKTLLVITEIPYAVNKTKLIDKIVALVREKKIDSISDIRDESNKEGIRIVIELKKDAMFKLLLNQLYSYTSLQTSFGIIMLALDKSVPKVMNLKYIIKSFIEFREEVITNRSVFLLNRARKKSHLLIGVMIAVINIDEIISTIRNSLNSHEAKKNLMNKKWNCAEVSDLIKIIEENVQIEDQKYITLTEAQAQGILDIKLQRLTLLEKDKISQELSELKEEIEFYLKILGSRFELLKILKGELLEIKEKFSSPRRTEIIEQDFEENIKDLIPNKDVLVTITQSGYIKRVDLSLYRSQNRGGKGRIGLNMKEEDFIKEILVANSHTKLLIFSNFGRVYSLDIYKIPYGNPQSRGKYIINLLPFFKPDEKVTNIMSLTEEQQVQQNLYLVFLLSSGFIKRHLVEDFVNVPSKGKMAIMLGQGEHLVNVNIACEEDNVILSTKKGKLIHFPLNKIRVVKSRSSKGVRGIKIAQKDVTVSMDVIRGNQFSSSEKDSYLSISLKDRLQLNIDNSLVATLKSQNKKLNILSEDRILEMASKEEFLLTVAEKGIGKFSSNYEYRITHRGGVGISSMNLTSKTGNVVTTLRASFKDQLMIITDKGQLIRSKLDQVRVTGRLTTGVKLFDIASSSSVVSVSLVKDEEELAIQIDEE